MILYSYVKTKDSISQTNKGKLYNLRIIWDQIEEIIQGKWNTNLLQNSQIQYDHIFILDQNDKEIILKSTTQELNHRAKDLPTFSIDEENNKEKTSSAF